MNEIIIEVKKISKVYDEMTDNPVISANCSCVYPLFSLKYFRFADIIWKSSYILSLPN